MRDQYLGFVATTTSAMTAVTAIMNVCAFARKVLFTGTSLGVEGDGMSILRRRGSIAQGAEAVG